MTKILLVLSMLIVSSVQAAELLDLNQSIRALGMGGAYLTSARNGDALFYNPAELADVSGLHWEVANLSTGLNGLEIFNLLKGGISLNSPSDYNKFFGTNVWLDAGGKTSLVMPNFGIAAYSSYTLGFQLHNPAYPQFNTTFLNDLGFIVGGALQVAPMTTFGMNLKRITRWGGSKDIGVGTIVSGGGVDSIKNAFDSKGVGYGIDASLMYKLPTPLSPTFVLSWQDIGVTSFQKTSGTEAPSRIKDNLSAGLGLNLDLPGLDVYGSFDYKHINDNSEQLGKKLHFGTEVSLPFIDIRAGLSQGYPSYGVGMNLFLFRLDAAYYFEEMGIYPGQTPENRILIGLSVNLGFDANFNFTDNNGKNRKLKQRR